MKDNIMITRPMMTREEKLYSLKGDMLIQEADKLGVKVACNKTRTQLKESKQNVIDRILAFEASQIEEVNEVEEDVAVDEVIETVVDNESELTDEEYAKIGLEIAEQAKEKSRKHRECKKVEFVGDKPTDDSIIDRLENANINYKKYDNRSDFSILDENGKAKARVFIQNKKMRIQTKSLNEFASKLSDVITGYKHTLSNVIFVKYTDTCLDTMLKIIE